MKTKQWKIFPDDFTTFSSTELLIIFPQVFQMLTKKTFFCLPSLLMSSTYQSKLETMLVSQQFLQTAKNTSMFLCFRGS